MKKRYLEVFGVRTNILTFDEAVEILESFLRSGKTHYINVNAVSEIIMAYKNEKFKNVINNADLIIPDGMPLVWLSRLLGYKLAQRVTGPDLMLTICARSAITGHSHFFYGGKEDVPELLAQRLSQQFPGLRIAGGYSPPFRPLKKEEDDAVVDMINSSHADFLWVGLGAPKQNFWVANHVDKLNVSVIAGVGAAFDYHSGEMRRAPKWLQNIGLEWIFRLTHYPGSVWKKYAKNLPKFVILCSLGLIGISRYKIAVKEIYEEK